MSAVVLASNGCHYHPANIPSLRNAGPGGEIFTCKGSRCDELVPLETMVCGLVMQ